MSNLENGQGLVEYALILMLIAIPVTLAIAYAISQIFGIPYWQGCVIQIIFFFVFGIVGRGIGYLRNNRFDV